MVKTGGPKFVVLVKLLSRKVFVAKTGGGGEMFWAGVIDDVLLRYFRVLEGINLAKKKLTHSLNDYLTLW